LTDVVGSAAPEKQANTTSSQVLSGWHVKCTPDRR